MQAQPGSHLNLQETQDAKLAVKDAKAQLKEDAEQSHSQHAAILAQVSLACSA